MTKAEKKKLDDVARQGCVVCRKTMGIYTPAVIHHLLGLENGRAMGKKAKDFIPLCVHHHTGFVGIHTLGKRTWEEQFGTQAYYLEVTNFIDNSLQ